MRILKYIFLLLLLALFATTVFVATQKGNFDVVRSAIIKSPKSIIFNYVNDYRNWETFGSWKKEDPKMTFYYPKNTVGKGGSYSWKGNEGDGTMKTIATIENQSIQQQMNFNGSVSKVFWTFKDTVGGTKVSWRSKGNMGFAFKIYSVFQGGADKIIGNIYEKSLVNLDKTLDYELNTYNIKVNGIVQKTGCFYMKQSITSTIANVPKNLRIMLPRLMNFFKKNNLVMYGKPFVLYHTYDVAKGITRLSVCIPIKEAVFIREESDVMAGQLIGFKAVKTTLTGDYSHSKEAWNKTLEYISKHNLNQNETIPALEMYTKSAEQIANPSQWVTSIYLPIAFKPVVQIKPKPTALSVIVAPTPAANPEP